MLLCVTSHRDSADFSKGPLPLAERRRRCLFLTRADNDDDYFLFRPSNSFSLPGRSHGIQSFHSRTARREEVVSLTLHHPRLCVRSRDILASARTATLNKGILPAEVPCATLSAPSSFPGIFRIHKHLAAFSASIMQKSTRRDAPERGI